MSTKTIDLGRTRRKPTREEWNDAVEEYCDEKIRNPEYVEPFNAFILRKFRKGA